MFLVEFFHRMRHFYKKFSKMSENYLTIVVHILAISSKLLYLVEMIARGFMRSPNSNPLR